MRRATGRVSLAAVGAALLLLACATTALADGGGPKPTIESESASNVTATDATLEALVNPGSGEDGFSLETTYEFFLESPWCGSVRPYGGCEASGGVLVYKGTIAGGAAAPQLESVDLASVGQTLSPATTYGYRVVARNEVGEAFGFEKTFTTPGGGSGCVEDPQDCIHPGAPTIEAVSVSHVTKTDATLQATIDTEGLATEYAFHMWSSPCSKHGAGCELMVNVKLPCGGRLLGSFLPQTVSLDLNSAGVVLGEGEYGFSVTASNADGETAVSGGVFEALEEPVVDPLRQSTAPGPSNDSQAPLAGGQSPTAASGGGPAPAGEQLKADTITKPAHGKPAAKHGKRHKHKHHPAKGSKHPKKHG